MENIKLETIPKDAPLDYYLVAENGTILHSPGDVLCDEHFRLLRGSHFEQLFMARDGREIEQFKQRDHYQKLAIDKVLPGMPLSNIYDDRGHLIVPEGTPADEAVLRNIAKRGIMNVIVQKVYPSGLESAVANYQAESEKLLEALKVEENVNEIAAKLENATPIDKNVRKDIEKVGDATEIKIDKSQALENIIKKENRSEKRSDEAKKEYKQTYATVIEHTQALLSVMNQTSTDQVNKVNIREIAKSLIDALIRDRELLINCMYIPNDADFIVNQTVNSTVVSINIATMMGMSLEQIMEICYGALVHDVGMYKISEIVRNKKGRLNDDEWMEITRHPGFSLDILENVHGVPGIAAVIAYQIHERLDGSGYPKRRKAPTIHLYSKIVMVADAFCAMTSPRNHRNAYLPYSAMEKIIEVGSERKFDTAVLRALLKAVGLYPIGSYVVLSNMKAGKVICLESERYDRPTVRLLFDLNSKAKISETVNLAENPEIKVVKAIDGTKLNLDYAAGF